MTFPRLGGAAIAVVAAAAMWSCGGGSSSGSPTSPGRSSPVTVNILGQNGARSFSPNPASAKQGDMLIWRNTDSTIHRIVLNDGTLDTGDIAPGASSAALRLATDGANYHCTIHPAMVGSINVPTVVGPPCQGPYC